MPSDPKPTRASKKGEENPKEPPKPPKMRRREFLKVAGLGALAAALGISKAEAQEADQVAQATTPPGRSSASVRPSGQAQNRLMDGGGAGVVGAVPTPMTPQEFQEQIAYMFDLTGQFEVSPDNSGRYTTDEFIVKRSTGLGDMAPFGCIAIYAKNSRDGVTTYPEAVAPIDFIPYREEETFRVFKFRIENNSLIHDEVVAIVANGGIALYYFNKSAGKYAGAISAYGPNRFSPNPKVGLEMNNQGDIPYIGFAVMDPEKLGSNNVPLPNSEVAAITMDLKGDGSRAVLGAGLYVIEG